VKKKILVTGATGFLGSVICRKLLITQEYDIIGLKRKDSSLSLLVSDANKIQWEDCDVLDVYGIYEIMENIDIVIHTAAVVSFDGRDYKKMMETNVTGTANVVNAALENNVSKFIHISSIAAIGRKLESNDINEKNSWTNSKYNTNYAISKFQSEQEVWRGKEEGLDVVILNPSVILGAQFWKNGSGRMFNQVDNGLKFYTEGINGFVNVVDIANYVEFLLKSNISGERIIMNGDNLSYKTVFTEIAKVMGKKVPTIAITPFLREVAWRVEWIKSRLTGSRPLITKETAMTSALHFIYENSKSLELNPGFQYTPILETIQTTSEIFNKSKAEGKDYGIMPI
jgi:dihydroflavonol-4-reductase